MRSVFIFLILYSCFFGCAQKDPLSEFGTNKDQELGTLNIKNSKISNKNGDTEGIVSIVYLNKIYPKKFQNDEYFYLYMYINGIDKIENINFIMQLNEKLPTNVKKLQNVNEFSEITSIKNRWNRYYLVKFQKENNNTLNFIIKDRDFASEHLIFYKDEE